MILLAVRLLTPEFILGSHPVSLQVHIWRQQPGVFRLTTIVLARPVSYRRKLASMSRVYDFSLLPQPRHVGSGVTERESADSWT